MEGVSECMRVHVYRRTAAESLAGIGARPGEVLRSAAGPKSRVLGRQLSEAHRRRWHGAALGLGRATRLLDEGPEAAAVLRAEKSREVERWRLWAVDDRPEEEKGDCLAKERARRLLSGTARGLPPPRAVEYWVRWCQGERWGPLRWCGRGPAGK
ncbi:hypothetical protein NDU88_002249 [Pleurodeles waltl]|uniref:Uncharacterized protein n=1 Tax=Pleurodeles waltl TaxID=8319 RepID=A0AAV7U956_PLEWA|nr:hypothetical protein NDU88_002249 [Pleurodeles waltl]